MNTEIVAVGSAIVVGLIVMVVRDVRKRAKEGGDASITVANKQLKGGKTSLQAYLPLQGFHPTGPMIVNGKFRNMIRVGDVNLYTKSYSEIQSLRDRFKDMLIQLEEPFQISVQARRANYTDYLKDATAKIDEANDTYQNPAFRAYSEALKSYLKTETAKPRTDRENLMITGTLSKSGTKEEIQLERLQRETGYVLEGLRSMRIPFELLDGPQVVEAIQNFWSRDRAVSQRYRDMKGVHASVVDGERSVKPNVRKTKNA